jgi:hypothetical protein
MPAGRGEDLQGISTPSRKDLPSGRDVCRLSGFADAGKIGASARDRGTFLIL